MALPPRTKYIPLFLFLILFLFAHHIRASNLLLIVGRSLDNDLKEALMELITPNDGFTKKGGNESMTFRIFTQDVQRMMSIIARNKYADVSIEEGDSQQTILLSYLGTSEMMIEDLTFLYQIVRNSRGFGLIEIGDDREEQTAALLRISAKCDYEGKLKVSIPNAVFLCNGMLPQKIPLIDEKSIEKVKEENEKLPGASVFLVSAASTGSKQINERHDGNVHAHGGVHAHGVVHPHGKHRKRPSRRKLEHLSLSLKHARLLEKKKHHRPEVVVEMPMRQRKLLCKYRKSCYETGIIPMVHAAAKLQEKLQELEREIAEDHDEEISVAEIKLKCKYRKSCYEEVGAEHERLKIAPKRSHVLAGRKQIIKGKPRKRRTLKEIAHAALKQMDEQEKRGAQRPKPTRVIVDSKLSELEEQMKKRIACRYRKSCYETGVRPIIEYPDNFIIKVWKIIAQHIHTPGEMEVSRDQGFALTDNSTKKIFCRYRKSCYETGIKPVIKCEEVFKYIHVIEKDETKLPMQIRCKYRKSCYETGQLPTLKAGEPEENKTEEKPVVIETLSQLKIHCKWRKSCYKQKAFQEAQSALEEENAESKKEDEELEREEKTEEKQKKQEEPVSKVKSTRVQQESKKKKSKEGEEDGIRKAEEQKMKAEQETVPEEPKVIKKKTKEKSKKVSPEKEEREDWSASKEKLEELSEEKSEKKKKTVKSKKVTSKAKTEFLEGVSKLQEKENLEEKTDVQKEEKEHLEKEEVESEVCKEEKVEEPEVSKKETEKVQEEKERVEPEAHIIKKQERKKSKRKGMSPKQGEIEKEELQKTEPPTTGSQITSKKGKKKQSDENSESLKTPPPEAEKHKSFQSHKAEKRRVVRKEIKEEKEEKVTEQVELRQKISENATIKKVSPKRVFGKRMVPKTAVKPDESDKARIDRHKLRKFKYVILKPEGEKDEGTPQPKTVDIDGIADTYEEKLKCKYRKSCYRSGTLPKVGVFKVHHLVKKEEQHLPLQLRCKYRKSCYQTGQRPNVTRDFKVVHLVKKKEEHIPIQIRCKYRKSCYETGIKPEIESSFLLAHFQSLIKQFYEEEALIKQEMSEEERKLSCKYRKSCYETGKLPEIEKETIKTIADTMKEPDISIQLRCKYRKSCYASMKLDAAIETDKKKERRQEVVITEPSTVPQNVRVKVKTVEDKKKATSKEQETEINEEEDEEQEKEKEYKQIRPLESEKLKNKTRTVKEKLKCKYRKKCYEGIPVHLTIETKKAEISMKGLTRADGRPCSIYYISCRKMAGLPIKERAPIGPNGKRLCRKKPKEASQ